MGKRATLRISLEERGVNIPYAQGDDVFPYRRLVDHPDQVDLIPEVKGLPGIRQALLDINKRGNPFETARIVTWQAQDDMFSRIFAIGFYFQDRALFEQQSNCILLAGKLMNAMLDNGLMGDETGQTLLEIQPALLKEEGRRGWIMDLYLVGSSSSTQASADDEAQQKAAWLADFLNRQT